MSQLRDRAHALSRTGTFAVLSTEKLLMMERVSAHLDRRPLSLRLTPAELLVEIEEKGFASLGDADLRRMLGAIWTTRVPDMMPVALLDAALARQRQSLDRAIIHAWLLHHPVDHPGFETLRASAAMAAERHDWRWREAGEAWRIWDADVVPRLAERMRTEHLSPADIGLTGRLADGAFAHAIIGSRK